MLELPTGWSALCGVVFLLGIRHRLDADHLATIDGLTRLNHRARPRMARYCRALFSLGHGAMVLSVAMSVGLLSATWTPPAWLSIGVLSALGIANLRAVGHRWAKRLVGDPLITRADRFAARVARVMSFTVAAASLGLAGIGAARLLSPPLGRAQRAGDRCGRFGVDGGWATCQPGACRSARAATNLRKLPHPHPNTGLLRRVISYVCRYFHTDVTASRHNSRPPPQDQQETA